MNRSLLKKCWHESRLLLGSCAVLLFAFCWARVWIVAQFEMSRFKAVLEQFRQFERFSPVPFEQLFTYAGRIALTYDEPIVVACMSLWAISRGSDCIAGELGRGTMEMLLSQPVSRTQVIVSHGAVTLSGAALLAVVSWLGVTTGIHTNTITEPAPAPTITIPLLNIEFKNPLAEPETITMPMSQEVDHDLFITAAFNLFALGVFLAGISTLMSSWDRYRWRTIGLVVGFYFIEMIVKVVGLASDRFAWMAYVTFFTAYEPEAFVNTAANRPGDQWHLLLHNADGVFEDFGPLGYSMILIAMGVASYVAAIVIFRRRDLPAPL